jgi:hypothetical protein
MVVAGVVLCLVAAGCRRSIDAVVANPCEATAEIRFSGSSEPPSAETKWFHPTVVPPSTSILVKDVLADVGESVVGYIEVRLSENDPRVIAVPRGSEEELVAIVIPAMACSTA